MEANAGKSQLFFLFTLDQEVKMKQQILIVLLVLGLLFSALSETFVFRFLLELLYVKTRPKTPLT